GGAREELAQASAVAARELLDDPGMARHVAAIEGVRQFRVPPAEVVDPRRKCRRGSRARWGSAPTDGAEAALGPSEGGEATRSPSRATPGARGVAHDAGDHERLLGAGDQRAAATGGAAGKRAARPWASRGAPSPRNARA